MRTLISAFLLLTLCLFNVHAQTGKTVVKAVPADKVVAQRVIDVAADGTRTTTEYYTTGTLNKTITKVKAPKGNDVVHQEENINNGVTTITVKKLANGKTVTPSAQAKVAK